MYKPSIAAACAIHALFRLDIVEATEQPVFRAVECRSCTEDQVLAKAAEGGGHGVVFVYDLERAEIRKFSLDDRSCKAFVSEQHCPPLEMLPVDPSVLAVFGSLADAYRANPELVRTGKAKISMPSPSKEH